MKPLTLILIALILFSSPALAGRRCTGSSSCSACTTCSGCKYCNEGGGTCGVCSIGSSYEEPEPEPEPESTPIPEITPASDNYESNYSSDSDYARMGSDALEEEKEPTSYNWVWWVLGIVGFFWLVGSLGKK